MDPNVADLAAAMRELQEDFGLNSVRVTLKLGELVLSATVAGNDLFVIEDDRGNAVMGEIPSP